jgi:hypothetical protein
LFRLYDWRVPVVLADGAVVAEGHMSRQILETALKRFGVVGADNTPLRQRNWVIAS